MNPVSAVQSEGIPRMLRPARQVCAVLSLIVACGVKGNEGKVREKEMKSYNMPIFIIKG